MMIIRNFYCLLLAILVSVSNANNLHVANSIFENEPVGSEAANLDKMLHGSIYGIGEREYQLVETKLAASSGVTTNVNTALLDDLFVLEGSRLAIKTQFDRETLCPNVKANACLLETSIFVHQKEPREVEFMLVLETTIRDVNDNEPNFPSAFAGNIYRLNVTEGDPVGTRYQLPDASDLDSNDFGIKNYTIEGPAESLNYFRLVTDNSDGTSREPALELKEPLDRETTPHLQLRLVVADKGVPALSSTLTIDVQILDENDNTPQFEKMEYLESLQESYDLNGAVTNVRATDRDEGENARVSYFVDDSANAPGERGMFVIPNPSVGQVRLAKPLDYEQWPEHRFKIVAVDHGKIPRTGSTLVTIRVLDVNDQPPTVVTYPTVPNEANEIRVKENSPIHTAVAVIKIKEPDGATSQQVQANAKNVECHIQEQEIPRSFYLVAIEKGNEYILKSNSTYDREIKPTITVQIQCVNRLDAGSRLATNRDIAVHIVDENDNAPIFERGSYQVATLLENSKPGSTVHKFMVTDVDAGANGEVTFSLVPPSDVTVPFPFAIHPKSGKVTVTDILDREARESYTLKVIARDNGPQALSSTATLVVNLIDENDNPPEFERSAYNFLIPSDAQPPYRITQFSVSDDDSGDNAIISLEIDQSALSSSFKVEPTGAFYLNEPLPQHYWTTQNSADPIEVKIIASDNGVPRRRSVALTRLYLVNKSDSSLLLLFPTKSNYTLPVSISLLKSALGLNGNAYQNQVTPPAIGQVVAVTDDNYISQGAYLTYELLNSNSNQQQATVPGASPILFRINKTTGAIYVDTMAMAAASQQQQQVPVVVNPGDRYSLAVVIRLSVPPFNKSFAIERFNRLDIVFQDVQPVENRIIGDVGPTGASITSDLRSIGLVVGLAVFAGFGALLVLFLVVLCRKTPSPPSSRNGFLRSCVIGPKALKASNGTKGIVVSGCATGNTSPCGSSSSKQTTSDTKPLSVDIMGCGNSSSANSSANPEPPKQQNSLAMSRQSASQFENSMFPVERLKLNNNRIDEENNSVGTSNSGTSNNTTTENFSANTLRRNNTNGNKVNMNGMLIGVATPRLQQARPDLVISPNVLDETATSPLSDKHCSQQNGRGVGQECSSSSIVSNSSTNSAVSTGVSSGSGGQQQGAGDHDGSSGRGTEEPPSAPSSTSMVPRSILVMKSPMPPPRPTGLYPTGTSNIAQYHVYPRVPPQTQPHRSQQYLSDVDETPGGVYRSPENGANYFVYNTRHHHSDHYLLDSTTDSNCSADEMRMPNSASGTSSIGAGCPIHGGGLEPAPPPYRSCPVHGVVIPVGGEATFSPTSILRNHHNNAIITTNNHQLHHQQPPQPQSAVYNLPSAGGVIQQSHHIHGTML